MVRARQAVSLKCWYLHHSLLPYVCYLERLPRYTDRVCSLQTDLPLIYSHTLVRARSAQCRAQVSRRRHARHNCAPVANELRAFGKSSR